MKFRILLLAALFVLSFAAVACSDDPENQQEQQDTGTTGDGDGDDVSGDGDDTGAGDTDDAGAGDTEDAGEEDAGEEDAGEEPELPESCAEAEGDTCNSNYDCPDEERCTSLSDEEVDFCCVPGERGTAEAGEVCDDVDGQAFCESALCVAANDGSHLCTTICDTADDCPESMNECGNIPFTVPEDVCIPQ